MRTTEKNSEAFILSAGIDHQALVITALNDCKTASNDSQETFSAQCSIFDLSQKASPFTEDKNSLHGSKLSLNDAMELHGISFSAAGNFYYDSKIPQKKTKVYEPFTTKSPKR